VNSYDIKKRNDQWELKKRGATRASLTADTKAKVIQQTHRFMAGKIGSVRIHTEGGQYQEERTYPRAKDPKQSPG
jgi:hypothetical protein